MTTVLIALCMAALCVHFRPVAVGKKGTDDPGTVLCQVRAKGEVRSFSNHKIRVRLPCKFEATKAYCQGYRLHVAPIQALDSEARYFTKNIWVSVKKRKTDFFWKGRTGDKHIRMLMNGTRFKPFITNLANMAGAPFNVTMEVDRKRYGVTLGVTDAEWKVVFYAYDEADPKRRKRNGVHIYCPEAEVNTDVTLPDFMCGVPHGKTIDARAMRDRKKNLRMKDQTAAIIYGILNSGVEQPTPQCQVATDLFQQCSKRKRAKAVATCSHFLSNYKTMQCLNRFSYSPMDVFIYCLKYKCTKDIDSCDLMLEALEGCPATNVVKKCK